MVLYPSFVAQLHACAERLFDLLERFSRARVLVVGDLTLDEFLTGQVERISREAPVLILRHETTQQIPGGGANAVYNLAQLGVLTPPVITSALSHHRPIVDTQKQIERYQGAMVFTPNLPEQRCLMSRVLEIQWWRR